MKVFQVPFCFYPDAVGGTEVYVADLSRSLAKGQGCEVVIAAPGAKSEEYVHDGLRVRRFATSAEVSDVSELYGEGDELAAAEFEKILEEEQPDLVHLHALTRGVSLKVLRKAKARGIPIVFTYHTPTATCTRGTMMRWGRIPCDGEMLGQRCTACTLHGLLCGEDRRWKLGNRVAQLSAWALSVIGRFFPSSSFRLQSPARTALRMRDLVEKRHATARTFLSEVDHIVAVCNWVRDVLLINGVPEEKITLCRQGVAFGDQRSEARGQRSEATAQKSEGSGQSSTDNEERITNNSRERAAVPDRFTRERALRLAFFGRLDPTKGAHIVISALRSLPSAPITLDIYGVVQGQAGGLYQQRLSRIAHHDPRITFRAPVPSAEMILTMRKYDAVVVPSQLLETGPLVALEAFAAGVPIIGSNLGSIAELIQSNVNGILVSSSEKRAWRRIFQELARDPKSLGKIQQSLKLPRTMLQVATETARLYESIIRRGQPVTHAHI